MRRRRAAMPAGVKAVLFLLKLMAGAAIGMVVCLFILSAASRGGHGWERLRDYYGETILWVFMIACVVGSALGVALLWQTRLGEWFKFWSKEGPRPDRERRWEKRARRKRESKHDK